MILAATRATKLGSSKMWSASTRPRRRHSTELPAGSTAIEPAGGGTSRLPLHSAGPSFPPGRRVNVVLCREIPRFTSPYRTTRLYKKQARQFHSRLLRIALSNGKQDLSPTNVT
jgi:hypothetical protein